jgi:hypothetical protein
MEQLEAKKNGSKFADVDGKAPLENPDDTEFRAEDEKGCEEEDTKEGAIFNNNCSN